jgi:arylsulfatase A-like enzyme
MLFLPACADNEERKDSNFPNIMLITIDTLRRDHLSCYDKSNVATPGVDFFAELGVKVENAYTHCTVTAPSHATLLSSTYPMFNGVRENGRYRIPDGIPLLQQHLQKKGYKTAAFISGFPLDSRFGFDRGFDAYDDDFSSSDGTPRFWQGHYAESFERRAEHTNQRALKWLRKNEENQFFIWIHYFDPHSSYRPPSPYKDQYPESLYAGEVAYVSAQIGELRNELEKLELLDDIFVMIASDHGESLGGREEYLPGGMGHSKTLFEEEVRIPLIFYYPALLPAGHVVKETVVMIDVVPTLLDLLGIDPLPGSQGKSYKEFFAKAPQKQENESLAAEHSSAVLYAETFMPLRFEQSPLFALSSGRWKYILASDQSREMLFNLDDDPLEKNNLASMNTEVASELRIELDRMGKKYLNSDNNSKSHLEPDPSTLEKLRALGYIQ